ncbi:hypothetical protein E2C01_015654 [Portunus trituberculatus]|uniref:Uncharacterized protein n=1 Tax=Portunus trituberculatus TaxID=210409 RepID=A0A5B7DNN9_PORTR|nr:hypothetical protein [Portunus trituberculatus]
MLGILGYKFQSQAHVHLGRLTPALVRSEAQNYSKLCPVAVLFSSQCHAVHHTSEGPLLSITLNSPPKTSLAPSLPDNFYP